MDSAPFVVEEAEVYHAKRDHMSASQLKLLSVSAQHHKRIYQDRGDIKETPSLLRGRMIHMYLLEPDKFKQHYAFMPDRTSKEYEKCLFTMEDLRAKAAELSAKLDIKIKTGGKKDELIDRLLEIDSKLLIWDRHVANLCEGKTPIKVEDQGMLLGILESIKDYKQAMKLIEDGIPEVSGYWRDKEFDIDCKFRTDWINSRGFIIEVKSCTDVEFLHFKRQIKKLRYDIGASWYVRGYHALMNKPPRAYVWFVVQTQLPYGVALYVADDSCLSRGEYGAEDPYDPTPAVGFRQAIERFKTGKKTGRWPGVQTEIQDMNML